MNNNTEVPEIILRALRYTVTDIGQLSKEEKRDLEKYVRKGILAKGKGGAFPKLKTVYAVSGFDFMAHRKSELERMNFNPGPSTFTKL